MTVWFAKRKLEVNVVITLSMASLMANRSSLHTSGVGIPSSIGRGLSYCSESNSSSAARRVKTTTTTISSWQG